MSRRTKIAVALTAVFALHAIVVFAGFLSPYDCAAQNREFAYVPPTHIHFVDAQGGFHFRPFVYLVSPDAREDTSQAFPVRLLVQGAGYKLFGLWPARLHLFGVDDPARVFLLGTDQYGRDQFSRLLHGGQISLLAGLLASVLSVGLGLLLGLIAGFYGRLADESVMRFAELFMVLPWLYLLLAVKAFLPLNLGAGQTFLVVVMVIGAVGWARPARMIRGVVLTAKERNFVVAARGFGASSLYILRRHILPQTAGVVLTQATLLVPLYSLSEITLSFLGLGVSEPVPSWGNMLAALQQYHVLASYWWMFLPAVPVVLVFWSYYVLANVFKEPTTA